MEQSTSRTNGTQLLLDKAEEEDDDDEREDDGAEGRADPAAPPPPPPSSRPGVYPPMTYSLLPRSVSEWQCLGEGGGVGEGTSICVHIITALMRSALTSAETAGRFSKNARSASTMPCLPVATLPLW